MRTVSACACARVQSRLSTAAVAAAFFSSVRREVGMAFLPETVSSFLRRSFFFTWQVFKGCAGKSTRSKGEVAATFACDFLDRPSEGPGRNSLAGLASCKPQLRVGRPHARFRQAQFPAHDIGAFDQR